jgi:hypothetical protein
VVDEVFKVAVESMQIVWLLREILQQHVTIQLLF